VQAYVGYIWGDNEVTPMAPPPLCPHSHSVARNLGFQPPRNDVRGGRAGTRGPTSSAGVGGAVSPQPCASGGSGRPRGRSSRLHGPGSAIADDNFDPV
jgi:hypothetical protein